MKADSVFGLLAAVLLTAGCHRSTEVTATPQDVQTARDDAQREVERARLEAAKDVKSATKVTGSHPNEVMEAKATGKYDVAMVKADGDHKVATESCLTLQAGMQPACRDKADADYEAAKTAAKAARLALRQ